MENPYLTEELLLEEDQQETFQLTDTTFAEALQLQEALFSEISLTRKASKAMAETEKFHGHGQSSYSFCEICKERKGHDQTVTIQTCLHSFCLECINTYIEMKISDNVGRVACAGINCGSLLELDNFRLVLNKDAVDLWEEALCKEQITESHRFYCPFESCSVMLVNDAEEDDIRESECPACNRLFCASCRVPWHFGINCEEFRELKKDGKAGDHEVLLKKLAEERKWKKCPKCRFYVERTEGCVHMTCRCKFEFCYGCGERWNDGHFDCSIPDDDQEG